MSTNLDSPAGIRAEISRVLKMEADAISRCVERLAQGTISQGFVTAIQTMRESLDNGGKIVVTGIGKSGKIAQKISATLASTGSNSVYLHPTEGLHGDLGMISKHDSILALSYTGNTEELIRLVPALKSLRVPIIGMGGNSQSQLAKHCDAWIDGHVELEACPHGLAPTTSTTLALALGDAIAVTLMQLRGFDTEKFAMNHPGGSIGRKLNLTVADLMHQGEAVGTAPGTASMDEIIVISTEKKLGLVLITDGAKLLGIITDGDIRRALKHREKFFSMIASDVMTRSPSTAHPKMKAQEALQLMENRASQISVLPVVEDGNWVGVLRLHDLVRSF